MTTRHFFGLICILSVLSLSSCSGNGAEKAVPAPLTVDSLNIVAENLIGDTIEVKGLCTHLCSHGGTKAFIQGADTTIVFRCNAGEAFGGAFSPDCTGKEITVKGILRENRIGETEIAEMEARLAASDTISAEGHDCATSAKAAGRNPNADKLQQIADYREKIALRAKNEGKNYLSFYYIDAIEYTK